MTLNKSTLYTPKEALDADPAWTIPVKLGRGRMPKGGDEHCKTLVAAGYKIKGYNATASVSTSTASSEPVVTRSALTNIKEVKEFTIYWPEDAFKAVDKDGKEHSMRWCDRGCGVSLVQCLCPEPIIPGDIRVTIKPR